MSLTYKANILNDNFTPGVGMSEQYYQTGVGWGAYANATAYADRYAAAGDALRAMSNMPSLGALNNVFIRELVSADGGTTWTSNGVYSLGIHPGVDPAAGNTK